ncbi:hypothetical protein RSOLAG1IB_11657 [Rhizoctonia solani AG-1 IB]|uniref:Uncharacterized protein n=1 Tax=Thanatephorus cucumeris (strain AG1-IB / isolate 7/3/14) TaxID=1108050 RepID=A0A0B7F8L5_THACB|nr:hypothetical protein RSOLAG1IB_11657 [Rhizoctonia solani AG-1 IB]
MASRPTVSICTTTSKVSSSLTLPAVLTAPICLDVVQQVHKSIAKNKHQMEFKGTWTEILSHMDCWGLMLIRFAS